MWTDTILILVISIFTALMGEGIIIKKSSHFPVIALRPS